MKTFVLPLLMALVVACAGTQKDPSETKPAEQPAKKAEPAKPLPTGVARVKFTTTAGDFVVEVHPEWAPVGAARFLTLVRNGYFDGSGFFRVVPGFVVQFGLAADPADTKVWVDSVIRDDPVKVSNRRGTVVFATAGPNTRTTQIFINYGNNGRLDRQGFAPFGRVVEGMERVDRISAAHGQSPDQGMIRAKGNEYLKENFPKLDYIETAKIVE
jgi:cyclophilin family peptidyl-prolyl cis-trans isomerase